MPDFVDDLRLELTARTFAFGSHAVLAITGDFWGRCR
jgi:hypothetical protein